MKTCSKCKLSRPTSEFHKRKGSKDGLQSQCKECNIAGVKKWQSENPEKHEDNWKRHTSNRNWLVTKARLYNIHPDDLQKLISESEGVCGICKKTPVRWTVIDHCHNTTKVRGILCEKCNQGLGLFSDSPEILASAIDYLQSEVLDYREYEAPPRQKYK